METLAHGIAGSVGGMVAMAVLYPLDQIKTIMQVEGREAAEALKADEAASQSQEADAQADAAKPEKKRLQVPASFWVQAWAILKAKKWQVYQGHVSTQVALGGSNFVYFFCYNGLKTALVKRLRQSNKLQTDAISPLQNLVLSCLAGVINVYATAPLWVVNMRLKSKDHAKYSGVADCLAKVAKSEGVLSLWNGTMASLMLVSNPVIHYVSYERMKLLLQQHRLTVNPAGRGVLSAWEIFVLGAIAKSFTTLVTYPLQVAQSLMRVQEAKNAKQPQQTGAQPKAATTLSSCMTQIYRENGVAGYFAGLEAKLLQTVLTAAISLVTYEKLLALILVLLRQKPKAIAAKA